MTKRKVGNIAEKMAADFLSRLGFELLERNYYAGHKEIDIIAKKDEVLHFVEVKSAKAGEPVYNITKTKLKNIISCAEEYLLSQDAKNAYCIDAVIVKNGEIEYLQNVTL